MPHNPHAPHPPHLMPAAAQPALAYEELVTRLGRRGLLRIAAGLAAAGGAVAASAHPATAASGSSKVSAVSRPQRILQPGIGPVHGHHYLRATPDTVRWGYVPARDAEPVLRLRSGETLTVDAVSHEGLLEDQGRDPIAWFAEHGVRKDQVLKDAVDLARDYTRTPRSFDTDGPHVVLGPVHVEGAEPGDVLKVETLSLLPRVPYGVISSRHGKGALARTRSGGAPDGITLDEVMPPVAEDGRATGSPEQYGNVSVFTPIRSRGADDHAVLPLDGPGQVTFPLNPHMGLMGTAYAGATSLTDPLLNSIPPTLGGGNIDIRHLGEGSTFYLPVHAEGALFHTGDPHFAMGNGEVALTALEGSLRTTFRLTVCKPGSGDAPSVAFHYPFGETDDAWLPVGLSDPDGSGGSGGAAGQLSDLDTAMRRAVVNALDFLQSDLGMTRPVAYAYLSAAADFEVSQVVDRTTGVHAVIRKRDFGR